eukprot:8799783-Karenia_brevis.AAC.1
MLNSHGGLTASAQNRNQQYETISDDHGGDGVDGGDDRAAAQKERLRELEHRRIVLQIELCVLEQEIARIKYALEINPEEMECAGSHECAATETVRVAFLVSML